jgi:hypothetical protein
VWSEHRDLLWPKLLNFWGLPNLQVINRDVHAAKCAMQSSFANNFWVQMGALVIVVAVATGTACYR